MQSTHSTVLSTLQNVQGFMDSNAAAMGALNQGTLRQSLDSVVAALTAHAVSQATSKQTGAAATSKSKNVKTLLLVNYVRPIAAIAAVQLANAPDIAELKLPKASGPVPNFIAAVNAMKNTAAGYEQTFIDAGMKPTFLADFGNAINTLAATVTARGTTKSAQVGATAGLAQQTKTGRTVVKMLDKLMDAQLATTPALLAQWKSVKRFTGRQPNLAAATLTAGAQGTLPQVATPVGSGAPTASTPTSSGTVASTPNTAGSSSGTSSPAAAAATQTTASAASTPTAGSTTPAASASSQSTGATTPAPAPSTPAPQSTVSSSTTSAT